MCHFRAQNVHSSWTIFFGTNHYYYFHLSLLLLSSPTFSLHKIKKKILMVDSELCGCTIFGSKMVHLPQANLFLEKIINILFIYQQVPFIKQNFQKSFAVDPELWGCTIFGPKMVHFPKWEFFFRKPVNEPCFFHSCLSTCQKSKSDINLLMKYWRLKNTEISLADSLFWL